MGEHERETAYVMGSNNQAYISESVMKYRLDTRELLMDIEMQLRGQQVEYTRENGELIETVKDVGEPLMNDKGIQAVISYLRSTLGPHTVQGNFDRDGYDDLIMEVDIYLSENVMVNLYDWDVDIKHYNHILDTIVTTLRLFFSRTIDNKERDSYASTMRSIESNRYEKSGGFSLNPFKAS